MRKLTVLRAGLLATIAMTGTAVGAQSDDQPIADSAPSAQSGQPVNAGIELAGGYDDNVYATRNREQDDFYVLAKPFVRADLGAGGGGGGATAAQGQAVPRGDLDRTRDQDRLCDRDGTCDYDQDRDQDRLRDRDATGDQDRDQDRDRLQTSQLIDGQLATLSLLTSDERARFQSEMRNATTAEERNRIRAEHQKTIQERAREMGIEAPAGAGAAMGPQARGGYMLMTMLTEQERVQFMNRMHSAQTVQERQRIRTEMQAMARERARAMGVDVPEWYGRGPGGQ